MLSVLLKTDVLMSFLGSGDNDFFRFGYELKIKK